MEGERPGTGPSVLIAPAQNLRKLVLLRHLSLVGQVSTFAAIHQLFAISLPIRAVASLTGFLVVFNLATYCRLQFRWEVTDFEVLAQILVDVGSVGGLLYFSGGASNPFIGLFFVPLAIGAVCLPRPHLMLALAAALACCGLLAFFHASMPALHESVSHFHLLVFTATCVAGGSMMVRFVVTIAASLRKRPQAHGVEEGVKPLADFGALATSVVHEIRSPLTTMAVLVRDLLKGSSGYGQEWARDLRTMSDQIDACRRALSELTRSGETPKYSERRADEFLDEVVGRWRVLQPDAALSFRRAGVEPSPAIFADLGLSHAMLNLLNNAAEAAPGEPVEMSCRWSAKSIRIVIADRGGGFPKALKGTLGRVPVSTKRSGAGIGLLLARTSIEQCGGRLTLSNGSHGGRVEVVIPAHAWRTVGGSPRDAASEVEEQSTYGSCAG